MTASRPILQRIFANVREENGCLIWQGSVNSRGYGTIRECGADGKTVVVHRVVWESVNGPIPQGVYLCRTCRNPACVRLEHLYLTTPKEKVEEDTKEGRRRYLTGEEHGKSSLTQLQARVIRTLWPHESVKTLARRYGVSISVIQRIVRGETYPGAEPITVEYYSDRPLPEKLVEENKPGGVV